MYLVEELLSFGLPEWKERLEDAVGVLRKEALFLSTLQSH
jgi:hypothetical protein